jgi:predicted transcriptional regulator YdeE
MKLQIQRKITIDKPAAEIYRIIADISKWNIWSPWIHSEPTAKTQVHGLAEQVGQTQTWDGEVIGSGKMTIEQLEVYKAVTMKLEFFKPWKSIAESRFEIKSIDSMQSEVIWIMSSNLPFFMFFFKKMMMAYMGHDFERGLRMLKEFLETGTVVSKSIYQGIRDFAGFQIVGKKTSCKISELAKIISADFENLDKLLRNSQLLKPDAIVSLDHKFDVTNGVCIFTAGYVYHLDRKVQAPQGLEIVQVPAHRGVLVDYYGPYRNISNGWGMAVSYLRGKKMKSSRQVPMYENYVNMPDGRDEKDIYTQIIMPLK